MLALGHAARIDFVLADVCREITLRIAVFQITKGLCEVLEVRMGFLHPEEIIDAGTDLEARLLVQRKVQRERPDAGMFGDPHSPLERIRQPESRDHVGKYL